MVTCTLSHGLSHSLLATQLRISLHGFFLLLAALGFVLLLRTLIAILSHTEPLLRRALRRGLLGQEEDTLHSVGLLSFAPVVAMSSNVELHALFARLCFVLILVSKWACCRV